MAVYVSDEYWEMQKQKAQIDAKIKELNQKSTALNHECHKCSNGLTMEENFDIYYEHLKKIKELKERSKEIGAKMSVEQRRALERRVQAKVEKGSSNVWPVGALRPRERENRPINVIKTDNEEKALKRCEHLENKYAALKEAVFEVCGERVYNQVLQKADSIDFGRGANFERLMKK